MEKLPTWTETPEMEDLPTWTETLKMEENATWNNAQETLDWCTSTEQIATTFKSAETWRNVATWNGAYIEWNGRQDRLNHLGDELTEARERQDMRKVAELRRMIDEMDDERVLGER